MTEIEERRREKEQIEFERNSEKFDQRIAELFLKLLITMKRYYRWSPKSLHRLTFCARTNGWSTHLRSMA
jgi:hypothetical protein